MGAVGGGAGRHAAALTSAHESDEAVGKGARGGTAAAGRKRKAPACGPRSSSDGELEGNNNNAKTSSASDGATTVQKHTARARGGGASRRLMKYSRAGAFVLEAREPPPPTSSSSHTRLFFSSPQAFVCLISFLTHLVTQPPFAPLPTTESLGGEDVRWSDLPEGILLQVFEVLFKEPNGRQLVRVWLPPPPFFLHFDLFPSSSLNQHFPSPRKTKKTRSTSRLTLLLPLLAGEQVSNCGQVCKGWHDDAMDVLLRDTAVSGRGR